MVLFRSEDEVRVWCGERARTPGAILPVAQLGRLARAWYGDRFDADWRPRTAGQSQTILDDVGLRGDFWRLG